MRGLTTLVALLTATLLDGAPMASATPAAQPAPHPMSAGIGMDGATRSLWMPDEQVAADLDAIRSAGAGWVRLDIDWSSIESTRGRATGPTPNAW